MGFGSPNVYSNLNSRAPLARTPFFAPFPLSPPRCSSPPPRAHEAHGGEGRMFVVCHLHSLGRTNTVRKIRRLRSGSPWVRRAHVKGPGSWVLGGGPSVGLQALPVHGKTAAVQSPARWQNWRQHEILAPPMLRSAVGRRGGGPRLGSSSLRVLSSLSRAVRWVCPSPSLPGSAATRE